jgi:ribonuclease HII
MGKAKGRLLVAGVDEAGRGPLAGPVFAAAVILDPERLPAGLDDSKRLSPSDRACLEPLIMDAAIGYAVASASAAEIDALNILKATMLAMRRAIGALDPAPVSALIDGNQCPAGLACRAMAIVGGDASEPSIAAASILAKVGRDRLLDALDGQWPGYGFARHKGYPTREHLAALRELGPCPEHRRSFRPVREVIQPWRLA